MPVDLAVGIVPDGFTITIAHLGLARAVDQQVGGNLENIGVGPRDVLGAAQHAHEHFLSQILRLRPIVDTPQEERHQRRPPAAVELCLVDGP
jgi:hypothetical protein